MKCPPTVEKLSRPPGTRSEVIKQFRQIRGVVSKEILRLAVQRPDNSVRRPIGGCARHGPVASEHKRGLRGRRGAELGLRNREGLERQPRRSDIDAAVKING